MKRVKIFIVDNTEDIEPFKLALQYLEIESIKLVPKFYHCSKYKEFIENIKIEKNAIALLDIGMSLMSFKSEDRDKIPKEYHNYGGLFVMDKLKETLPIIPVIFYTAFSEDFLLAKQELRFSKFLDYENTEFVQRISRPNDISHTQKLISAIQKLS